MTSNKNNKKRQYSGRTRAFSSFQNNYWKTETLLQAGLTGLVEDRRSIEKTLGELADIKAPPGPVPKGYKLHARAFKGDDGKEYITMDPRGLAWLRKVMSSTLAEHKQLRYHLYSILAVSIWSAFETYMTMLFEELYEKQNSMLKSSETITFSDAVTNGEDLIRFLIDKKLEAIGHFTLKELLVFLKDKIKFQFSVSKKTSLEEFYIIRNIVAHNSGIVRNDLKSRLPSDVLVVKKEVRITKDYLERMLKVIRASVVIVERHIDRKFYK